ncbi:MAG: metal-dependent hydrolase [Theionarchaea archaeon]|nr:metal-dependent hydrolase [Theionarchaea archaeon]MBU6999821.1 metal-dependent hydrolase [Theionarchaea archaeon]MBU7020241.1 metal-dependent hydrolase [Theionarchaea archaeon]MBU7033640.1 metal-dependent hydrolase [Theionarchaea archaeon]MBU7040079.1 metal-dependent hydrolase [Theionarchaea archaeon]
MNITYLSHACFELKNTKTILIDPFFKDNPNAPSYSGTPDLVLVTHEHYDHSDAEGFDTVVVCPEPCRKKFKNPVTMKIGDRNPVEGIPLEMVEASHHQSSCPTGFIIKMEGNCIYHMGDTYLDGVSSHGTIDILFIPIGGHYTMNIEEALKALDIVKPMLAIPMHYNTFPQIKADPHAFKKKAEEKGFSVKVFKIGERAQF